MSKRSKGPLYILLPTNVLSKKATRPGDSRMRSTCTACPQSCQEPKATIGGFNGMRGFFNGQLEACNIVCWRTWYFIRSCRRHSPIETSVPRIPTPGTSSSTQRHFSKLIRPDCSGTVILNHRGELSGFPSTLSSPEFMLSLIHI